MDRKSIIVIVACLGLMALWVTVIVPKYLTQPVPPQTTDVTGSTDPAGLSSGPADQTRAALPNVAATNAPLDTVPATRAAGPEELLEVLYNDIRYTFTSQGGGLKRVDLLNYPESTARGAKQVTTNGVASLNAGARLPVLDVLGDSSLASQGYTMSRTAEGGVRTETQLSSGLTLIKEFTFMSNYMFTAQLRFENRTDAMLAVPVHEVVVGTATPLSPQDDGREVGVMWHNDEKLKKVSSGWFANRTLGCFPGTPRSEYQSGPANVAWTAVHNQFFTLAAIPETNAASVVIRKEGLPRPSQETIDSNKRVNEDPLGYQTSMVRPGLTLQAGASASETYYFYAGPKEYQRLARLSSEFGKDLDQVMGYSGFFGFFAKALLLSMNWLHNTFKLSYGLAIIAITVIIKLLFWPLTQASTRSMKRMQALQPQMTALRAKFKDDPAKMNKKLMEFMRENKVSPLGGCLPMVLQIPVFFGFFKMIRSAIELRGASFLWVTDLSQPDTLFMIPGIDFPFNLLPLIMGATMLWQSTMTPMSPSMDPMQQKMMRYMPLMFMFILYNYSAGLTLYWTVQNLLTVLQTKLTKMKDPVVAQVVAKPQQRPMKKARRPKK